MTNSVDVAHQQVLELVAKARLCCDAFQLASIRS
jgi:hypothetical protein